MLPPYLWHLGSLVTLLPTLVQSSFLIATSNTDIVMHADVICSNTVMCSHGCYLMSKEKIWVVKADVELMWRLHAQASRSHCKAAACPARKPSRAYQPLRAATRALNAAWALQGRPRAR